MTSLFLSHRSVDNEVAADLRAWLAQEGHEQLFLDFDPMDGIPAGVDWEQRLYKELRRCQALIVVLTPAWLDSSWCRSELAIAREKGKAVFVVRVKPVDGGPVIPAIQEVNLVANRDDALRKLARGLREHGLNPGDSFRWSPGRPIYPGLAAFDVEDAPIFFGRSEESWTVVERLRRMRLQAAGAPKLLLITGASGSGKSSLMRAGVLPRLGKEPAGWIVGRPFRRGADALAALARSVPETGQPDVATPDALLRAVTALRDSLGRPNGTLVLALDQAEELLRPDRSANSAGLLDLLREALSRSGDELLVLATIRSDQVGAWQQHPSVRAGSDHPELPFEMAPLGPMPLDRVGAVVRGPAAHEGLLVEDALVEAILRDIDTPDALPLLAYTLRYMRDRCADDGRLTLADYRAFGGLEGSIRSQADMTIPIERLNEEDRTALHQAFVPGLVRATPEGGFVRNRARLASLPPRAEPFLRRLVDEARLLQTARDAGEQETLEVAHEALLRVWPTLTRWLEEDGAKLRRLEALQRAAADWDANDRTADYLVHRVFRLGDAELLASEPRFAARLTEVDRAYLAACRAEQNRLDAEASAERDRTLRAAQTELKRRQRQVRTAVASIAALIGVLAVAGWQYWAATRATKAAQGMALELGKQVTRADDANRQAQNELARANDALAGGIWNLLDFRTGDDNVAAPEMQALCRLAANGSLAPAFMRQLWSDSERMNRFAYFPAPIGRALGMSWPTPAQALEGLPPLLDVLSSATATDVPSIAVTARVLGSALDSSNAGAALDLALGRITLGRAEKLAVVRQLIEDATIHIPPPDTQAALGRALAAMAGAQTPEALGVAAVSLRGLASGLPPGAAAHAKDVVIALLAKQTDPGALRDLARGVQALNQKLSPEQAETVRMAIAARLSGQLRPDGLEAVAHAIAALPSTIGPDQLQVALDLILPGIKASAQPSRQSADTVRATTQSLLGALSAIADQLASAQALAAMNSLQALAPSSPSVAQIAPDLWLALGRRIEPSETLSAIRAVLTAMSAAGSQPSPAEGAVSRFGPALAMIAMHVPPERAAEAFQALILQPDAARLLDGIRPAAVILAGRLPADQAMAALGPVLQALARPNPPEIWMRLIEILGASALPLGPEQAQAALEEPLNALARADGGRSVDAIAPAVEALAGRLDPAAAEHALARVLAAIKSVNASDAWDRLAHTAAILAARVQPEQARAAIAPYVASLAAQGDARPLWALRHALPPDLMDPAREAAIAAVLVTLGDGAEFNPARFLAVLTLGALGAAPDSGQGQAALKTLAAGWSLASEFDAPTIERAAATAAAAGEDARRAFLQAQIEAPMQDDRRAPTRVTNMLAAKRGLGLAFSAEQQKTVRAIILKALAGSDDPDDYHALSRELAGPLSLDELAPALDAARQGLAWAGTEDFAALWAGALGALLSATLPAARLPVLVEALRMPIAAGAPTPVLLAAINAAQPDAPGREAGLRANLAWLGKARPDLLDAPFACPKPP